MVRVRISARGGRETARAAKVTGKRRLPMLLCASCEASWGEACLLARKDAARAQE